MGIISLTRRTGIVTIKLRMKRTIFVFIVLLVVLGLIAWVYFDNKETGKRLEEIGINIEGVKKSVNWEAVPENIEVPEMGDVVEGNIASPAIVGAAGNNTTASFRGFEIEVNNNQFSPSTIIVKLGDTVSINFIARDKTYEFFQPDYGFKVPLPQGKTTPVQFQGSATGKFRFYCESCGGPDKGPVGYIVVAEK